MTLVKGDDLSLVGIIANPASGKDIRRLVAFGSVFDNQEKVRIVRRVLLGLAAVDVSQVSYMPDYFGIVERAVARIDIPAKISPLQFKIQNGQEDSTRAAEFMARMGATCIITLGGDGTNRAVFKGTASVPILPISTGTNNVFPAMVEGTIAGLAAGLVARGLVPLSESTSSHTCLEVVVDGHSRDLALVDAVVYDDVFIGSRAVWDMSKVHTIFLNRAEPDNIGLSSIGGLLRPVGPDEPAGLCLELGASGRPVTAPVAPGVIRKVYIRNQRVIHFDEDVAIRLIPSVLALDGEREVEIHKGQLAAVRLSRSGPKVVDVTRTMTAAMHRKLLAPGIEAEIGAGGVASVS
jgi:predicted polyphosphate/ATP-dependent NAD kinase